MSQYVCVRQMFEMKRRVRFSFVVTEVTNIVFELSYKEVQSYCFVKQCKRYVDKYM